MNSAKLIKLLNETNSSDDDVALNALRQVQKMLIDADLDWIDIIEKVEPEKQIVKKFKYSAEQKKQINDLFEYIYRNQYVWPNFNPTFVNKLYENFQAGIILSDNQIYSLSNIADKLYKMM